MKIYDIQVSLQSGKAQGIQCSLVEGILDEYKRTRARSNKEEIKRTRSEAESFATIIIREFLQLVGKTSGYVLKPERT